MKTFTAFKWVGLALLGILVAASVAVAASRLASQQIGLASEPISAGEALAPAGAGKGQGGPNQRAGHEVRSTTPSSPPSSTPSTPQPTVSTPTTTPPTHDSREGHDSGDHDADD